MIGIAKELPAYAPLGETIAEVMPTRSPLVSTRAPPLFPILSAASVWINDSILSSLSRILRFLPLALTIPAVTVEVRSSSLVENGLPTARTHSPSLSLSESPYFIKGKPLASIFSNAISVLGSLPTILASNTLLSFSLTSTFSASSIT